MADIPVLAPAEEPASGGGGKGKWITIIIAVVLVVAGAGAGAFLGPFFHSPPTTASRKKDTKPVKEVVKGPPLYAALDPPFVVNFEADQAVRFLQITVQVMSRDQPTLDLLKANDPVVRNDLLLLFGNKQPEEVSTNEGKEALRAAALEVVRKIITAEGHKPEALEGVYFTSFVMQ